MKCIHESDISSETHVGCDNHAKLVLRTGVVPKSFCANTCPYRVETIEGAGDVVAKALDSVGITKNRVAAVLGDCGCAGRQADMNDAIPINGQQIDSIDVSNGARHLMYRVYAVASNDSWQWNLQQLSQRWHVFTGQRVLAVGYDEKTIMPDAVIEYAKSLGLEFDEVIRKRNVPSRREVTTWVPMLESLNPAGAECDELVFAAHSKGVRHMDGNDHIRLWAEVMYSACLDDMDRVLTALQKRIFTGAFRRFNQFDFPGNHVWHYSGTFYWFRLRDIAQRNWRHVDQFFAGTESWPGAMAQRHEGSCLFADNCGDLYNPEYWKTTILPMWQEWKAQHAT
jgi:hypothetical protein